MEKIKAYIPLNLELMANPINWVIITLMVLIAGLGLSLIMSPTLKNNEAVK